MSYTNFKVSGLTAYIEQNKDLLIKNIAFGRGSRERMSIQTGVKFKEHLHILDTTPVFASGLDCGFTGAGEVEISERLLECPALKVNMEICPENLLGKYAEYLVRLNANETSLPFEQYVLDGIVDGINRKIETMIWQGDKTQTTDAVKKWIDGFVKICTASVSASTGCQSVTIASGTSAYDGLKAVYAAMTENTLERGGEIYVSPAIFRAYMQDLVALNFYHYNPGNEELKEFNLPGTDVKVVRTAGLAGQNYVIGTYAKNLFYGCDMENDNEDIKLWFSEDNQTYRLLAKWNSGVQIAFLDQCVLGQFAAAPSATSLVNTTLAGIATATAGVNTVLTDAHDATNHAVKTKSVQ